MRIVKLPDGPQNPKAVLIHSACVDKNSQIVGKKLTFNRGAAFGCVACSKNIIVGDEVVAITKGEW